jgi:hypothetical protein
VFSICTGWFKLKRIRPVHTVYLCLWYGSENKQRVFPYTSLTDLYDWDGVFLISLFHRAFYFTIYNGQTNAIVCNKTLIQLSQTKTFKITPTCFDHQMIIIRELSDPG